MDSSPLLLEKKDSALDCRPSVLETQSSKTEFCAVKTETTKDFVEDIVEVFE